jgi:DNA end-binding protein Ku
MDKGLLLEQLHYADEVRAFSEVPIEDVEVKQTELALAKQLIDQAASDTFDPSSYRDDVRDQMMAMIQRKIEGEDISVAPTEKPEHKIIDLMEALKASLNATDARKPAKRTDAKTGAKSAAKSAAKTTPRKSARKKRAG